jgi:hypothetical protein
MPDTFAIKKNAWYITTTSSLYVAKPVPIPSKVKKALCSQGKFILSPEIVVAAKPVPFATAWHNLRGAVMAVLANIGTVALTLEKAAEGRRRVALESDEEAEVQNAQRLGVRQSFRLRGATAAGRLGRVNREAPRST